jgi:hypothetical protein
VAKPVAYAVNRLEVGTVTVTGALTDRPKTRLYDRDTGVVWEDNATTGTRRITLDQGASPLSIDSVVVAAGHNLAGLTVDVEHDDNVGFSTPTSLGSLAVSGTTAFKITGTASSERYWRLNIPSPSAAPKIAEAFFSSSVTFAFAPSLRGLSRGKIGNVAIVEAISGSKIGFKRGSTAWIGQMLIRDLTTANKTTMETLFDNLNGSTDPLFLEDEDGTLRWVRWINPEAIFETTPGERQDIEILFEEQLD